MFLKSTYIWNELLLCDNEWIMKDELYSVFYVFLSFSFFHSYFPDSFILLSLSFTILSLKSHVIEYKKLKNEWMWSLDSVGVWPKHGCIHSAWQYLLCLRKCRPISIHAIHQQFPSALYVSVQGWHRSVDLATRLDVQGIKNGRHRLRYLPSSKASAQLAFECQTSVYPWEICVGWVSHRILNQMRWVNKDSVGLQSRPTGEPGRTQTVCFPVNDVFHKLVCFVENFQSLKKRSPQ